uniref:Uncharacterized protein n=1 Tax=Cacopsylla melanoneura TaxID=428564 RepID=A0A8D8TTB9_9HEMI
MTNTSNNPPKQHPASITHQTNTTSNHNIHTTYNLTYTIHSPPQQHHVSITHRTHTTLNHNTHNHTPTTHSQSIPLTPHPQLTPCKKHIIIYGCGPTLNVNQHCFLKNIEAH